MAKFVIDGVQKIRDVIEASDILEAQRLFLVKYSYATTITEVVTLDEFTRDSSVNQKRG